MSEKKLLKSEKIRIKNDKLRAKGKDPLKGWGKMVNTGFGGINNSNRFDSMDYIKDQQKNIAKENE
ncbi:hypothetical protein R6Z02_17540 [Carnobacterium maltaromaticum]|uniref:hypothetical protein n=1 Tax=Lactobacillales TaxID=186826 RepID=UPI00298B1E6B|nr:hypothetical protein [Carnobacterium maltaromaticum]MDW5525541.1 hypothetical protein [Carnobacterium maltaromaticum]